MLELITVFTMLSLTVTVVKWLIYNDRLSCSNPKGLKYKKKGMGRNWVGESGERIEEVQTRVEGLQKGIEQGKKDDDFVLYTLIYKFITAFSSKVA